MNTVDNTKEGTMGTEVKDAPVEAKTPVTEKPEAVTETPAQEAPTTVEEGTAPEAAPTEAQSEAPAEPAKPNGSVKPGAKPAAKAKKEQAAGKPDKVAKPAGKGKGTAKPDKAASAKPEAKGKAEKPAKGKTAAKPDKGKAAKGKAEKPAKAEKPKVEKDVFGFKKGSLKSQAAAMYSKGKGATLLEVRTALNSSQLNLLKELEAAGYKVTREKEPGKGKKPVTRYKLATAKGK